MEKTPAISVVVPTKDRPDSVLRLLRALARQEPVDGGFEAIVVADGCSDATLRRLNVPARWPFDVHVLEQGASGPSTARNCGAALARGEVLLFLDDDVEPEPGVLRTHLALHREVAGAVGLGYLPPVVSNGFMGIILRGWWEAMYDGPRQTGHRYRFRDLLGGHFSIRRDDFEALGGFDTALTCHEDWDLGYRAIAARLRLQFLSNAAALHHDSTDVGKSLRRKFDEGVADVQLVARHPELAAALPLGWMYPEITRRSRVIRLAWDYPRLGDRLVAMLPPLLGFYEHWRLRFRWRALLEGMQTYSYWRGVAHAVGSRDRLAGLLDATPAPAPPDVVIDLAEGIDIAESRVDAIHPASVTLLYRSTLVGTIDAVAGAEPLRGAHLRATLAGPLGFAYAGALVRHGAVPPLLAGPLLKYVARAAPGPTPPEAFAA